MSEIDFGRLLTAMITPFDIEGKVDYAKAEQVANHLIETGTNTIVVCGTTGESPTLSWDEEYQLFIALKSVVAGKAKIMAGTGSNSTSEAIAATQKAEHLGLDGTLQVVPYYNKPPQDGLYAHFRAIAEASPDIPMLLYNVPSRTGCKLEPTTIAKLAEIPSIIGVKEATGDLDQASQIRALTPAEFAIYSGDDSLTLPLMAVGAKGVVSVASHLVGKQLQAMMEAFATGKVQEAIAIHLKLFPLFKALFLTTNPIPLKLALKLMGLDTGLVRLPLVAGDAELEAKLISVLKEVGIIE
ncbi:4-hydroxy-tetrahydrodipicolinate synthase [Pseudanabaena sp. FACHB-1998]|uniref:4-hydroxy-tetrahydrodipicolinate synthase n=1 Tax=Pseudanabaena sp. FACHB-1998 TaxID=2692858 RepID=UPI0016814F61|nr:4-hydroxy-tetrahydrodipicolinate synthase [Pseudanabaena sp. FACHB-1998]MBD2177641.1 4-hydroxy-tetrahydrodipicolinate synthase [Pseudanabaena sp. FACHB-1998]